MSEYLRKLKRQIEIVGFALSEEKILSISDLASMFEVEELTIKRDLSELRAKGIDIHSTKRQGLKIFNSISHQTLKEFILEYISFSSSGDYPDKSTSVLIQRLGTKALSFIVEIQLAIENHLVLRIDYQSTPSQIKKDVEICPLKIFQASGEWRVLALNEGIIKQYYISKIKKIFATSNKFKPVSKDKIESLFYSSLKSWIGQDNYQIKIHFNKKWADAIKSKTILLNQKLTELEDGSLIFEGIVNSIEETASWIITFGEGAKVIEPPKLKERVIQLAKEVLSNYK